MPREKGKHLTFDDRCEIEDGLKEGKSFRFIAKGIGVSPTTVSDEVRKNRTFSPSKSKLATASARCAKCSECRVTSLCEVCTSGASACKRCGEVGCWTICRERAVPTCPKLDKAPFICTAACKKRVYCGYDRARYVASKAQTLRDARLTEAHSGISCCAEELAPMVETVKRLLGQGQSIEAIWVTHGDGFPVSSRTFYNYVERGVMGLANMQLPKKVKYAPRRKRGEGEPKMDLASRTFDDWKALPDDERLLTVEMDCVEGCRSSTKCILSLHFVRLFFQIYLLLDRHDQEHVIAAIDAVDNLCGGAFAETFPVILTDRGHEFLDFVSIEAGGRTRVYYCDPLHPGQKGHCEKNHVELRKILPKGTDLDALTPGDVALACSHVNSYPRPGRGVAPIALASAALPKTLLEGLGIVAVPPDEVMMTPRLLGL